MEALPPELCKEKKDGMEMGTPWGAGSLGRKAGAVLGFSKGRELVYGYVFKGDLLEFLTGGG